MIDKSFKPEPQMVTFDEAQSILCELDEQDYANKLAYHALMEKKWNQTLPFTYQKQERKPIAYGLRGSRIYGLNHAQSDRDLILVTNQDGFFNDTYFINDNDVVIMSLDSFLQEVLAKHNYRIIDAVRSNFFSMVDEWVPFFSNLRFNKLGYMDNVSRSTIASVKEGLELLSRNPRRAKKKMQVAMVSHIMLRRAESSFRSLYPTLSATSREKFFTALERVWGLVENDASKEEIFESITEETLKIDSRNKVER